MRWKIVPETITQEMVDEMCYDTDAAAMQPDWKSCLAAAPPASQDEELEQALTDTIWSAGGCDMSEARCAARAVLKMLEADHDD